MRICSDLGLKEAQEYATKLKKAEKTKELREQVRKARCLKGQCFTQSFAVHNEAMLNCGCCMSLTCGCIY